MRDGSGADGDRAVTRPAPGLGRRRQARRDDEPRRRRPLPAHLRHPQGRTRGHAGPDGHGRAGGRHRAGHQDPRPTDRDRQVVCRHHSARTDHVHRGRRRRSAADGFGRSRDRRRRSRQPSPPCAATSTRSRRRSARSRSTASGPTSWRARASPSNSRRARCASNGSTCSRSDASDDLVDVDVEVDCSSGTYIRALARDVGVALGVGGHLTALRRTRVGRFGLDEARTLDELADAPRLSYPLDEACLLGFPRRDLTADEAESAGTAERWSVQESTASMPRPRPMAGSLRCCPTRAPVRGRSSSSARRRCNCRLACDYPDRLCCRATQSTVVTLASSGAATFSTATEIMPAKSRRASTRSRESRLMPTLSK